MTEASAAGSEVIALPKGGGALKGIGETFAPDLHTGTCNLSVPLGLPPGRNGFAPQISLIYSSGQGNGPFGLGWALDVPGVSLKTAAGVPRRDASEVFLLSGLEDLVPIRETEPGVTRYRPRVEGGFARIERDQRGGCDYWRVTAPDGVASAYGSPRPIGAPSEWRDPAAIVDPAGNRVCAWRLSRTTDTFGNVQEYGYERDPVQSDGPHRWDQLYLSRIAYCDHGAPDAPEFLVTVVFHYEPRPDPFSDFRAGFEVRTVRRCSRIEVFTHAGSEELVRSFEFAYLDRLEADPRRLPANGASLLAELRIGGYAGARSEALPPLSFAYSGFEPARRKLRRIAIQDGPATSLADPHLELADLDGNGLPDLVELAGAEARWWPSKGDGTFASPCDLEQAPSIALGDPGVRMLDADGDGRIDLMVGGGPLPGCFPMQFEGGWDQRSFRPYEQAPSFDPADPQVRLVDLDGDGVTDAVRSGGRFECFFQEPGGGWARTRTVERRELAAFPDVSFSDPRVRLADMTGDGLQDVVLVHDGSVEYWPARGHGDWGPRVTMLNAPRFPDGYEPRQVLLGDVDGDGAADLIFIGDNAVTLWVNRSGNGFGDPVIVDGTPPMNDLVTVRLVDLLGTGVAGVLWSFDPAALADAEMFFLDLTDGVKPYLCTEMRNNRGVTSRVEYAPSTRFAVADARRRDTRWRTPLPFPVQVVARSEGVDHLSRSRTTTEYAYHHGYWDGADREFRGFARVDRRDSERFSGGGDAGPDAEAEVDPVPPHLFSPPTELRSWFHSGPCGGEHDAWRELDLSDEWWSEDRAILERPAETSALLRGLPRRERRDALRALRGRLLRSELYGLDGSSREARPYTVTEHQYGIREEEPPSGDANRRRVFFPFAFGERTTLWERGNEPRTSCTLSGGYDDYGQASVSVEAGVPRGRDPTAPAGAPFKAVASVTLRAVVDGPQRYMVDRRTVATGYELLDDGSRDLVGLLDLAARDGPHRVPMSQALNYYDGDGFAGLPLGQVGERGALVRTEALVLTPERVQEAYGSADPPPYLAGAGPPAWGPEYPAPFRHSLPAAAGYVHHTAVAGLPVVAGSFATTEQRAFDFQVDPTGPGRGMVVGRRDPLGNEAAIHYDRYELLPVRVDEPAGLTVRAEYDYRCFEVNRAVDRNGNVSTYAFTPLGALETVRVGGKPGERQGDTAAVPGTRLEYDLAAFAERGEPASVTTIRRLHHANDLDAPAGERDRVAIGIEYSDGAGRLLQARMEAAPEEFGDRFGGGVLPPDVSAPAGADVVGAEAGPSPRVLVSGAQVFDNKGRAVEKYEPYHAAGLAYEPPGPAQLGRRIQLFRDARGELVRQVNADGSEQLVIHGVPVALEDPGAYTPTPWEAYTYDANDNGGRTHAAGSAPYSHHWNTPSSAVLDALGRQVETVERLGPGAADELVTRSLYDAGGNLIEVQDPEGRPLHRYTYSLGSHPSVLREEALDSGAKRVVFDAAAMPVETRDAKGALTLHAYDERGRPTHVWARDNEGRPVTLRQRLVYPESAQSGIALAQAKAANKLGRLHRQYDEAGLLAFEAYDFKGNPTTHTRRALNDETMLAPFAAPHPNWEIAPLEVDWEPGAGQTLEGRAAALLEDREHAVEFAYDAHNRVWRTTYPVAADGSHHQLSYSYNPTGGIARVDLDGAPYVERIAYDAAGQRVLEAYGNGVMTRYAYHPQTGRLARRRTERYASPAPLTYRPRGSPLEDRGYEWDLTGNLLVDRDRAPGSGLPGTPDRLDRRFSYDPLYRLTFAEGRECDAPLAGAWEDPLRCADVTRARSYGESYRYDRTGNLAQLRHTQAATGFTRQLDPAPGSDRLAGLTVGGTTFDVRYDAGGNVVREATSRHFEWDHGDRLSVFRTQPPGAEPSVYMRCLYDASGRRVKKLVRRQNGAVKTKIYVGAVFEEQRVGTGSAATRTTVLHVLADHERTLASVRIGPPLPGDATPAVKFRLSDHLASVTRVLDDQGRTVSEEGYTPYGETSWGGAARKRYRFAGKERDESGLVYFGGRHYAPWTGRFHSVDRATAAGPRRPGNPYAYVRGNPLSRTDPDGWQDQPTGATTADDVERFMQIQTPVLPFFFGSAHTSWALRDQSAGIRSPLLRFQAQANQQATAAVVNQSRLATTIGVTVAAIPFVVAVVAGAVYVGVELGGAALLAGGARLAAAYAEVSIQIAVRYPTLVAIGTSVAAGINGVSLPSSGPAAALPASRGVWSLPWSQRGFAIGEMFGENLPRNFPTIDRVASNSAGIAEEVASIKSIDLTAASYQASGAVLARMQGYISSLASFSSRQWAGASVAVGPQTRRVLEVGIEPGVASAPQLQELSMAARQAAQRGIDFVVREVR